MAPLQAHQQWHGAPWQLALEKTSNAEDPHSDPGALPWNCCARQLMPNKPGLSLLLSRLHENLGKASVVSFPGCSLLDPHLWSTNGELSSSLGIPDSDRGWRFRGIVFTDKGGFGAAPLQTGLEQLPCLVPWERGGEGRGGYVSKKSYFTKPLETPLS